MISRLQIKLPDLEIQYEGSEAFMRDELLALVRAIADQVRNEATANGSIEETTGNVARDPSATPPVATASSPNDTGTMARDSHQAPEDRQSKESSRSRANSPKASENGGSRKPAPIRRPNGERRGPKTGKVRLPAVARGPGREEVLDVNGMARRLNARTAVDLTLSSAAFLALVQRQQRFDRRAISRTVQSADAFKPSVLSNLTKSLDRLVRRGDLERTARGQYALSAAASERLAALIES